MFTEADLLRMISDHLADTGESETAFGVRVAKDPNLVPDLRGGRSPRMRLMGKIITAIQARPIKADAQAAA